MKIFIILKQFLIITIITIGSVSLVYSQQDKNTQSNKKEITKKSQNNTKKKSKKFIPSEKISADSSVSFPVDI